MQYNPKLYNTSKLSQAYYRFFELALGYWLTRGNTSYNNDDFVTYGRLLGGQVDPTSKLETPSFQGIKLPFTQLLAFYIENDRFKYVYIDLNSPKEK